MITYGSTTLTSYNTITKIEVYYYKSTSATSLSGGSWSTTKPTWENGKYIWQKIRTTYEGKLENGQYYSESDPVNITGQQGQQGEAGTSAYSYKLNASDTIVSVSKNGIYSTNSITFSATSKQGNKDVNPYEGRFKIETTTDGITWTTQYTSNTNESSKVFTIPNNISNIRCSLYQADGTTVLLDITSVSIVRDGTDATGLKDSIPFYLASDKETDITIYDEGWSTIRPMLDATNKYLWVYYLSRYSNGTTDPELIEVSGDIATFENNSDVSPIYNTEIDIEPIQDLNGFDHAWNGGDGKNLLVYPYYTGDTYTSHGLTFTVEKYPNGAIKDVLVNGTSDASTFFNFSAWANSSSAKTDMSKYCGQSMILSGGTSDARIVMQYRKPNSTSNIYLVNDTGGSGVTFTVPDASDLGTWAIFISISSGLTFNNVRVYPMLRFASETDGTYEPYENICPIDGWNSVKIERTGKNLLGIKYPNRTNNGITFTVNGSEITVNGTATANAWSSANLGGITSNLQYKNLIPPGQYMLTGGKSTDKGIFLTGNYLSGKAITVVNDYGNGALYTLTDWAYVYPQVRINNGVTVENEVFNIQLEATTTATEYEPYCGNTYEIDFPTEAGTIFKGKLVIDENGDGQLIQTHKSIILDNTNRNGYNLYSPNIRPYWIIDDKALFSSYIEANNHIYTDSCIISHSGVINSPQNAKVQTLSAYTTKAVYVILINITTQEAMNAYLADHPIQLVYELAEPIIYHLTAKQILAVLKTNHIYANTGNTTVRYYDNQRVTVPYIDYSATSAFEYSVRAYEATQPLYTKTYSELIGSTNDAAGASFYFAKIHPDSYITNYKVKMKVRVIEPESYAETIDIQFGGYGSTFSSYDAYTTRTGSIGIYYINLYRATKTGIETNHKGHALGIGLKSATNPTDANYKRTVIVDILELDGCTIEMLDTAIKYANIDGTGSTNYSGITEMSVASVGQNATNNTNTSYTQYANAVKAGAFGVKRYTLLMKDSENTWSSFINQANSTATTKTVCQGGFLLGKLLYSAGGAEYASGANTSTVYDAYPFDFRYSTNCGETLISHQPVYLVGTIENDGLFYLDVSQWWTQTEPTYADGKVYIYIGMAYSTYQVWLSTENPAYVYYNGEFILYDKAVTLQNIASLKDSLETQIDSKVETWCQKANPASNWTAEERPNHTGDLWYYIGESGSTYKNNTTYQYNGSTNTWSAYSANPDLFDKIDGKTAIYYGTQSSVTSAEEGDYLVDSTDGSSYRWNNGAWVKVTDYKTTITNAIDAIEIGGRNLLLNTNNFNFHKYQNSTGGGIWNFNGDEATYTATTKSWAYLDLSYNPNMPSIDVSSQSNMDLMGNINLTLSIEAKCEDECNGLFYFQPVIYGNNNNRKYFLVSSPAPAPNCVSAIKLTEEWERYVVTFPADYTNTKYWSSDSTQLSYPNTGFGARIYWNSTGTVHVRKPKLERGNKATDWSPAPEDTQADIDTALAQSIWYATCSDAGATKSATITPVTTNFVLNVGTTVNVKFNNTNTGAVGSLTLNINNTGAKNIKYIYNKTLNDLPAADYIVGGRTYLFVYDGTYWVIQNMNYNTNETNHILNNFSGKTGELGIWQTGLFMKDSNGTYQNICTDSSGNITRTNANTKKANPNGFEVGSSVYLSTGSTTYAANSNISGAIYASYGAFDSRYSLNTTLTANCLTPYQPVYLVGTINNGLYYLDTIWWTQTPNDSTKVYVLVGGCYDSTTTNCRITLYEQNNWYKYVVNGQNGQLVDYTNRLAELAATTATSFITVETDNHGINVHPEDDMSTGWKIGDAIELFKGGLSYIKLWIENNIPKIRIGKSDQGHIILDNDSVDIKNNNDVIASFGETTIIGKEAANNLRTKIAGGSFQIIDDDNSTIVNIGKVRATASQAQKIHFSFGTRCNAPYGNYSFVQGTSNAAVFNDQVALGRYGKYGALLTFMPTISSANPTFTQDIGTYLSRGFTKEDIEITVPNYSGNYTWDLNNGIITVTFLKEEQTQWSMIVTIKIYIGEYVALMIGNGSEDNRSNAVEMLWDGNIKMALDTNADEGTTDKNLYTAITALDWENDVVTT